ncbi:MAG TPA: hypothetical protein VIH18_04710 [Candidatus Binatia bacterium]
MQKVLDGAGLLPFVKNIGMKIELQQQGLGFEITHMEGETVAVVARTNHPFLHWHAVKSGQKLSAEVKDDVVEIV